MRQRKGKLTESKTESLKESKSSGVRSKDIVLKTSKIISSFGGSLQDLGSDDYDDEKTSSIDRKPAVRHKQETDKALQKSSVPTLTQKMSVASRTPEKGKRKQRKITSSGRIDNEQFLQNGKTKSNQNLTRSNTNTINSNKNVKKGINTREKQQTFRANKNASEKLVNTYHFEDLGPHKENFKAAEVLKTQNETKITAKLKSRKQLSNGTVRRKKITVNIKSQKKVSHKNSHLKASSIQKGTHTSVPVYTSREPVRQTNVVPATNKKNNGLKISSRPRNHLNTTRMSRMKKTANAIQLQKSHRGQESKKTSKKLMESGKIKVNIVKTRRKHTSLAMQNQLTIEPLPVLSRTRYLTGTINGKNSPDIINKKSKSEKSLKVIQFKTSSSKTRPFKNSKTFNIRKVNLHKMNTIDELSKNRKKNQYKLKTMSSKSFGKIRKTADKEKSELAKNAFHLFTKPPTPKQKNYRESIPKTASKKDTLSKTSKEDNIKTHHESYQSKTVSKNTLKKLKKPTATFAINQIDEIPGKDKTGNPNSKRKMVTERTESYKRISGTTSDNSQTRFSSGASSHDTQLKMTTSHRKIVPISFANQLQEKNSETSTVTSSDGSGAQYTMYMAERSGHDISGDNVPFSGEGSGIIAGTRKRFLKRKTNFGKLPSVETKVNNKSSIKSFNEKLEYQTLARNTPRVSYRKSQSDISTDHFYNSSGIFEGTKFSERSSKGSHKSEKRSDKKKLNHKKKEKHRKKKNKSQNYLEEDLYDLGGADFDILMSNKLPRDYLRDKEKDKKKHKRKKKAQPRKKKKSRKHKKEKSFSVKTSVSKKRFESHPHVIVGEDVSDSLDEEPEDNEIERKNIRKKKKSKKSETHKIANKSEEQELEEDASGSGLGEEQLPKKQHKKKKSHRHQKSHHYHKHQTQKKQVKNNNDEDLKERTYKKHLKKEKAHDDDENDRYQENHKEETIHNSYDYHDDDDEYDKENINRKQKHESKHPKERNKTGKNKNRDDDEQSEWKQWKRKNHKNFYTESRQTKHRANRKHHKEYDDERNGKETKDEYNNKPHSFDTDIDSYHQQKKNRNFKKHHERLQEQNGENREKHRNHLYDNGDYSDHDDRDDIRSRERSRHHRVFVGEDMEEESGTRVNHPKHRQHSFHSRHRSRIHDNDKWGKYGNQWRSHHHKMGSLDDEDEHYEERWYKENEEEKERLRKEKERIRKEEEKAHEREMEYLKKIRHFEHEERKLYEPNHEFDRIDENVLGKNIPSESFHKYEEPIRDMEKLHHTYSSSEKHKEDLFDEKSELNNNEDNQDFRNKNRDWDHHNKHFYSKHIPGGDRWGKHEWGEQTLQDGTLSFTKQKSNEGRGFYSENNYHGEEGERDEDRDSVGDDPYNKELGISHRMQNFGNSWQNQKPFNNNGNSQVHRHEHNSLRYDEGQPETSHESNPIYPTQMTSMHPGWGPQSTSEVSPYPGWQGKNDENGHLQSFNNEKRWKIEGSKNRYLPSSAQKDWNPRLPSGIVGHSRDAFRLSKMNADISPSRFGKEIPKTNGQNIRQEQNMVRQNDFSPKYGNSRGDAYRNFQPTHKVLSTREKIPTGYASHTSNNPVSRTSFRFPHSLFSFHKNCLKMLNKNIKKRSNCKFSCNRIVLIYRFKNVLNILHLRFSLLLRSINLYLTFVASNYIFMRSVRAYLIPSISINCYLGPN